MKDTDWKNLDDQELINNYNDLRKDEIFKELYLRYNEKIFNYMKKYLYFSPVDIVEELLTEVFIKVYLHISKKYEIRSFKSWIYRVAHNICVNYIKSQKNMAKDGDSVLSTIVDNRIDIEKQYLDDEIRKIIFNEIKDLKHEIREIIVFKFYHDLTYNEISEITNIPIRTLKYKLKNVLIELGVKLKKKGLYNINL